MSAPSGQLRVYFSDGRIHALALSVDVTKKGDLYIGDGHLREVQLFKESWHITGKGHVYTPAGRQMHEPRESPSSIVQPIKLWSSGPQPPLLDWTYRPKERPHRVNVAVHVGLYKKAPSWSIDIWALPSTGQVQEVLNSYDMLAHHAVMEWTSPVILAAVWTMRPEAWASLERFIKG